MDAPIDTPNAIIGTLTPKEIAEHLSEEEMQMDVGTRVKMLEKAVLGGI